MLCALCKKCHELRNSHIIPEFMYRPLYDDKHRFSLMGVEQDSPKFKQKGLREKLLCSGCEGLLSRYEKYVSAVFSGKEAVHLSRSGKLVTVSGLDYHNFRIFGLSIIWRAGVSQNDFFKYVKLGPHEGPLRLMIRDENPGSPSQYGFFLGKILSGRLSVDALMMQPTPSRWGNHCCYRFVFGGFVWVFIISNHKPPKISEHCFISKAGTMAILESDLEEISFMIRGMNAIHKC